MAVGLCNNFSVLWTRNFTEEVASLHPFLHIGTLTFSTYKVITALAAVLGIWLIFRRVTSDGVSPDHLMRCIIAAFLGGFAAI